MKQSHSDIELHKKEKNDSKSKEIIPEHEVPETVDKPSPTKGKIPETVNKSKYPHEENEKEQEPKKPTTLIPENKYESVQDIDKVDSVDIPELEVVQQPPQTTFEDYPEELIKDVIQVDKTTSVQPKLTPSHQIPEDKPIDLSKPEAPIDSKKQGKQAHPEKTEESTNIKEETLVQAPEIVVLDDKKDAEIKRELEEMHEDTPKKKKTKKVKKKVTAETSPQEEKPLPGVSTEATIPKDTLPVDIKREESTAKEKLTEHIEKISIVEDAKSVLNEPSKQPIETDKASKAVSFSDKTTEFKESVIQTTTIQPEKQQTLPTQGRKEEVSAEVNVSREEQLIAVASSVPEEQLEDNQGIGEIDKQAESIKKVEPNAAHQASLDEVKVIQRETTIKTKTKAFDTGLPKEDTQVVPQKQMTVESNITDLHKEPETTPEIITKKPTELPQETHTIQAIQNTVPEKKVPLEFIR